MEYSTEDVVVPKGDTPEKRLALEKRQETMEQATSLQTHHETTTARQALELVKPEMARVEETLLHLPDIQPPALRTAVEIIVSSGGKRIRPAVALLIAAMFDKRDRRIIDLASAIEMLHTATLVHDDLIDGSLMRRGTSTLNAAWTPAATVLTGDYLFAIAAGLAARTGSVRAISIFADTLGVIVAGELCQQFMDWTRRVTREDYYPRIYAKTASMFVLATTAAGVISSASEEQIAALGEFGHDFGLAFQIVDDILDFTGVQANVGKPVGSDLRNGLITLPTICYHEAHPEDEQLQCALRGECDQQVYDELVARIRASDAIHNALDEATALAHKAKQSLASFPDSVYKTALLNLAEYTVERNK
ncbi:MAG: polyprenyl synthetase family protein [Chloroflexi bacterium]|nr:polyprenyl synthetase family protein [Chloroflexota bacterium]